MTLAKPLSPFTFGAGAALPPLTGFTGATGLAALTGFSGLTGFATLVGFATFNGFDTTFLAFGLFEDDLLTDFFATGFLGAGLATFFLAAGRAGPKRRGATEPTSPSPRDGGSVAHVSGAPG